MPTAVANESREKVLAAVRKVSSISTLPEVTAKIIRTVEDPRSSAQQLHQIVSHDPALVTRILKVVNSAFYGLPGQIGSIDRAIVMLGLNAVKNIAVAASLGSLFRGVKLCDGFTARDLWTHCVAVGVGARELAKVCKLPIADEAFLAGMIHDIGLLVELQTAPEQLRQVCDRAKLGGEFIEAERELTGFDHQQLGAALAELWKFPISCQVVAAHHHHPSTLVEGSRALVAVVHAADVICCREGRGFNLTAVHQEFDEAALAETGVTAEARESVRSRLSQLIDNAAAFAA